MASAPAERVPANELNAYCELDGTRQSLRLSRGARDRLSLGEGTQLVEIDFNGHPDGTATVLLTNHGLADEQSAESHRESWQGSFDSLARTVSR